MKRLSIIAIPILTIMLLGAQFNGGEGLANAASKKVDIKEKMLNSIDYYEYVEGVFTYDIGEKKYKAEFSVQEGSNPGSRTLVKDSSGQKVQELIADDDNNVLQLNTMAKTYVKMKSSKVKEIPKGDRVKKDKSPDGKEINEYIYRQDPANALIAKTVTFPQEYAFWLDDESQNYEILGEEKLLERNSVVISGDLSEYLAKKLNSTSFKMWVDEETGVLLKLITLNKDNKIENSIEVLEINFDTKLAKTAQKNFDTDDTKGYKQIKFDTKKPEKTKK
ncbi:hypothetical protein [Brevibacillus reuszeri]|uniref:hypothetical protein n=1 Tax=Brevibacillus reuszeri TaxID=54915 RepID=UPI000CCC7E45|nr:hypothetical protein [Brevibacillus reuszeri]